MTGPFFVVVPFPDTDRPMVRVGPVAHLAEAYRRWPFLPKHVLLVDSDGRTRVMEAPALEVKSRCEIPDLTPGQRAWRDRQRQRARSDHLKKHWTNKP